jgi:hypothetical protein
MIVFDLKCSQSHVFEAWFNNSSAYDDQCKRGLVVCPVCGDANVAKSVMAPNIPAKGNQKTEIASNKPVMMAKPEAALKAEFMTMMGKIAEAQAKALKSSEWVGHDFSTVARAMDAGEVDAKPIHGQASQEEAKALIEDGISIMPLLVPVVPPEKLN